MKFFLFILVLLTFPCLWKNIILLFLFFLVWRSQKNVFRCGNEVLMVDIVIVVVVGR